MGGHVAVDGLDDVGGGFGVIEQVEDAVRSENRRLPAEQRFATAAERAKAGLSKPSRCGNRLAPKMTTPSVPISAGAAIFGLVPKNSWPNAMLRPPGSVTSALTRRRWHTRLTAWRT